MFHQSSTNNNNSFFSALKARVNQKRLKTSEKKILSNNVIESLESYKLVDQSEIFNKRNVEKKFLFFAYQWR